MLRRLTPWIFGALITLLYVYLVVSAIGNLVLLPDMAHAMGLSVNGIGWFWLLFGVTMPLIVYGVALVAGRKRRAGMRVLLLFAGLAIAAMIHLEVLHLVPQSTFFA